MNLYQQETFFAKHLDPVVRKNGAFLLALVDRLQADLLVASDWANWPVVQGRTRMQEMKLRIILHALDRHNGIQAYAAKWLGISRQGLFATLSEWRKRSTNILTIYELKSLSAGSTIAAHIDSLPNDDAMSAATGK